MATSNQLEELNTLSASYGGIDSDDFKNYVNSTGWEWAYDKVKAVYDNAQAPKPEVIKEQAQPQARVEPQQLQQPQQPQPEVVQAEAPKDPEVPTTPKIEQPKAPVESAQDIKQKELNIKAQEETLKVQEEEKAENTSLKTITSFQTALSSGNMDEAKKIALANPDLSGNFSTQAKVYLENQAKTDYVTKYSGMSNEQMYAEVQAGNIVPWSANYKLLDPQQLAGFEQYKSELDAINIAEPYDYLASDSILSLDGIQQQISTLFSSDFAAKSNELLNSPEITETAQGLETLSNQIDEVDAELEALEKRIRNEYPTLTESEQNDIINDRAEDLYTKKTSLASQYDSKLGTYTSLKDNAQSQIDLYKYEDEQNRANYETALSIYESRRSEMKAEEVAAFEAQNTILAEERAVANQKALLTFQQELENNNQTVSKYEIGRDGKMYAFIGENAVEVTGLSGGEVIFSDQAEDSSWQTVITDNGDGTTSAKYVYDGDKPISMSEFNINWELVSWAPQALNDIINECRTTGQCAEGTYDYLANLWVTNENGENIRFGNTFGEKQRLVNTETPSVWAVAIYNPVQWSGVNGYWHTAIVTWVNEEKGTITITDWNWEGDEKMRTNVEVPTSSITSTWGFFDTRLPVEWEYTPEVVSKYTDGQISQMKSLDPTDMNSTDISALEKNGVSISDFYAYRAENILTDSDKSKMQAVLDGLQGLKWADGTFESADGFSGALGKMKTWFWINALFSWTQASDYKNKADSVLNNLVLENLDLMSGVLTDNDIAILRSAATNINTATSSEAWFAEGLKQMEKKYMEALGLEYIEETVDNEDEGTWGWTLLDQYNSSYDVSEYNIILDK